MKEKLLQFITKHKNTLLIVVLAIVILFLGYKLLFAKSSAEVTIESNPEYYEDYSKAKGIIKGKTLEELGLCAQENYIVAEVAKIRRTQNFAQNNTIYELKFGTTIYTKVIDSTSSINVDSAIIARENKKGFVAVYADKPTRITDLPVGFIDEKEFVTKQAFKNYKPEIKVEEIVKIDVKYLDVIEANSSFDDVPYFLSDNAERVKSALIFGDFNNDGVNDMAAIVDDIDERKSGVLVFFNKDGNYKFVYKKAFNAIMNAKTIKKETPITLKTESTLFPLDGIYISGKRENTYFIVYDSEMNEFITIIKEVPIIVQAPKTAKTDEPKSPEKIVYKAEPKTPEKPTDKSAPKKVEKTKP